MNTLDSLIFTFAVSLIVGVCTYLFQYCSTISPCNIEFDIRRRYEINIMNRYNAILDKAYFIAIATIIIFDIIGMVLDNSMFLNIVVIIELLYFVINIAIMFVMYIRSKLYWNIQETKKIKVQS